MSSAEHGTWPMVSAQQMLDVITVITTIRLRLLEPASMGGRARSRATEDSHAGCILHTIHVVMQHTTCAAVHGSCRWDSPTPTSDSYRDA